MAISEESESETPGFNPAGVDIEIPMPRLQSDELNQTSQPMLPPGSKLEIYADDASEKQSQRAKPSKKNYLITEPDSIGDDKSIARGSYRVVSAKRRVFGNSGISAKGKEQLMTSALAQHKEGFFMNHHMPFIKTNEINRIPVPGGVKD